MLAVRFDYARKRERGDVKRGDVRVCNSHSSHVSRFTVAFLAPAFFGLASSLGFASLLADFLGRTCDAPRSLTGYGCASGKRRPAYS